MIHIECHSCQKRLHVKDEFAGKRTKCPGCGEKIDIPGSTVPLSSSTPDQHRAIERRPGDPTESVTDRAGDMPPVGNALGLDGQSRLRQSVRGRMSSPFIWLRNAVAGYWTDRQLFLTWINVSCGTPFVHKAGNREVLLLDQDQESDDWCVGLPDACIVCGADCDKAPDTVVREVTDPIGTILVVLGSLGLALLLFLWFGWPVLCGVLIAGVLLGHLARKTQPVTLTINHCDTHAEDNRYPELYVASQGMLVRLGHKEAFRKFRQHCFGTKSIASADVRERLPNDEASVAPATLATVPETFRIVESNADSSTGDLTPPDSSSTYQLATSATSEPGTAEPMSPNSTAPVDTDTDDGFRNISCRCGKTYHIPIGRPWNTRCHVCGHELASDGSPGQSADESALFPPSGSRDEYVLAPAEFSPGLPEPFVAETRNQRLSVRIQNISCFRNVWIAPSEATLRISGPQSATLSVNALRMMPFMLAYLFVIVPITAGLGYVTFTQLPFMSPIFLVSFGCFLILPTGGAFVLGNALSDDQTIELDATTFSGCEPSRYKFAPGVILYGPTRKEMLLLSTDAATKDEILQRLQPSQPPRNSLCRKCGEQIGAAIRCTHCGYFDKRRFAVAVILIVLIGAIVGVVAIVAML